MISGQETYSGKIKVLTHKWYDYPNVAKFSNLHFYISNNLYLCQTRYIYVIIMQEFEFEMRCGINELDHRILSPLKQQREGPEKFKPERGFEP